MPGSIRPSLCHEAGLGQHYDRAWGIANNQRSLPVLTSPLESWQCLLSLTPVSPTRTCPFVPCAENHPWRAAPKFEEEEEQARSRARILGIRVSLLRDQAWGTGLQKAPPGLLGSLPGTTALSGQ